LTSSYAKSEKNMTQQKYFFINATWVSKNAEFDADFKSVEKVEKYHSKKVINNGNIALFSLLLMIVNLFCL
jgi:hypothetical protein